MSRSQAQFLSPVGHEGILVAIADGETFSERQGRDGLGAPEQPRGVGRYDPCALAVGRGVPTEPSGGDDLVINR
jgi:hypothetical protein